MEKDPANTIKVGYWIACKLCPLVVLLFMALAKLKLTSQTTVARLNFVSNLCFFGQKRFLKVVVVGPHYPGLSLPHFPKNFDNKRFREN